MLGGLAWACSEQEGVLCYNSCILTAVREHPEPCSAGGERGEAERRLHAVLQRGGVHQETGGREGGGSMWWAEGESPPNERLSVFNLNLKVIDHRKPRGWWEVMQMSMF